MSKDGTFKELFIELLRTLLTLVIFFSIIIRNASLGMNTFWTRVGGMAAPQIFFLVSINHFIIS